MCTAISVTVKDNYFGRNLDYMYDFGEKITITPRNYIFRFKNGEVIKKHYGIIGMSLPLNDYPLYFDATNEKGLSVAGLNFPDNAYYKEYEKNKDNIASFELIPWILCKSASVSDAKCILKKINITNEQFSEDLKASPLHWIVSDKKESITVEQTKEGLNVYENPVGVLTNNPPFDFQMMNLANYMSLSSETPKNNFYKNLKLNPYSYGMGAIGLPGDLSSASRFVKACFTKLNSVFGESEEETVNQFFHILYSVYQQKGCVKTDEGYEITNYTSCCNTDKGIYYYTTYNNMTVSAVDMNKENLDGTELILYDIKKQNGFFMQNQVEKKKNLIIR